MANASGTRRFPRYGTIHSVRTQKRILVGAIAVLLIAGISAAVLVKKARDHAAALAHEPHVLRLADGTAAWFRGDTTIRPVKTYPTPPEIHVDGDAYIQLPAGTAPWTVRTRLLVLTVDGGSVFRLTAYSKQTGEQVEVVQGRMEARKSYPSPYAVPDLLGPGEMVMINRTIDLMEKERTNAESVRQWGEGLKTEVAGQPN